MPCNLSEEEFRQRIYEYWYYLQPGNSIIPDEKTKEITESRRFKPHYFHCFPWRAVVVPDDRGSIIPDKIRISQIDSFHLLESQTKYFRSEGYHIEDLSEGETLGFPVNTGDGWILQDNICEWCGGPFADDLTARQKGKRIFCSDECKQKYRNFEKIYSQLMKEGKISDNFQLIHDLGVPGVEMARMLRDPCLTCGNKIPDDKPLNAKFCSNKCRYDHHNKMKKLRD